MPQPAPRLALARQVARAHDDSMPDSGLGGIMARPSVLVVDDDPAIRESLSELLLGEDYQVRTAANGAVALAILHAHPLPDLLILDLMMPVLSGWEVLEEMTTDESIRGLPVLIVSAMDAPVAGPGERGGVRMSLPKPLDVDVLLEAVRGLIGRAARASDAGHSQSATR
jgi:two-component system response regulator CpxR